MNRDLQREEREYVADLVQHISRYGPALRPELDLLTHGVSGSWPNTEVRLFFRVAGSPCVYGARHRIWDEDPIAAFGTPRAVTYTWLRVEELVTALPHELPAECDPDVDGVTWVDLD